MGGETKVGPFGAAFWEWLPGVVAGGLPMGVFLIGAAFASTYDRAEVNREFIAHMLILAIANSSVSIMSSFARFLKGEITNFLSGGRAPLAFLMLTICILLYVTALYDRVEGGQDNHRMFLMALFGLITSLSLSLYMEVTIAKLGVAAKQLAQGVAAVTPALVKQGGA